MKEAQSKINKSIAENKSPVILAITNTVTLKAIWNELHIAPEHIRAGWNLFAVSYQQYFKTPVRGPAFDEWQNTDDSERRAELFNDVLEESRKFGEEMDRLCLLHPMREYLVLANRIDMLRTVPEILEPEKYKSAADIEEDNSFKGGNLLIQSISKYSQ